MTDSLGHASVDSFRRVSLPSLGNTPADTGSDSPPEHRGDDMFVGDAVELRAIAVMNMNAKRA